MLYLVSHLYALSGQWEEGATFLSSIVPALEENAAMEGRRRSSGTLFLPELLRLWALFLSRSENLALCSLSTLAPLWKRAELMALEQKAGLFAMRIYLDQLHYALAPPADPQFDMEPSPAAVAGGGASAKEAARRQKLGQAAYGKMRQLQRAWKESHTQRKGTLDTNARAAHTAAAAAAARAAQARQKGLSPRHKVEAEAVPVPFSPSASGRGLEEGGQGGLPGLQQDLERMGQLMEQFSARVPLSPLQEDSSVEHGAEEKEENKQAKEKKEKINPKGKEETSTEGRAPAPSSAVKGTTSRTTRRSPAAQTRAARRVRADRALPQPMASSRSRSAPPGANLDSSSVAALNAAAPATGVGGGGAGETKAATAPETDGGQERQTRPKAVLPVVSERGALCEHRQVPSLCLLCEKQKKNNLS